MKSFIFPSASTLLLLACSGVGSNTGTSANAIVEPGCVEDAGAPTEPSHLVTVTANGTACAGRRFVGTLSADEKTLTISPKPGPRPNANEADATAPHVDPLFNEGIEPGVAFSIQDCTFSVDISNTDGRPYAARSLGLSGYAILDRAGVTAKQSAKWYFTGNPAPATELEQEIDGPYDSSIAFVPQLDDEEVIWSTGGRPLNILLRSVVRNDDIKSGTALLEIDPTFSVKLEWRAIP